MPIFGEKIKFTLFAKKILPVNVHDFGHVKVHYSLPDVLYLFYWKLWKIGIKNIVQHQSVHKDVARMLKGATFLGL